ncbi:hypothetical protein [Litchfieldia alkalitelluris]|uniref:hypothetical protein n=1 Tax=Litchfieldia alkalitelluris TaxID=304268 RepID=UPI00099790FA|nr:hypothetical protein [Litchfieldia alkalitelluris]
MKYRLFGGVVKIPVGPGSKRKILKAVVEAHMSAFLDHGIFPSWENYEVFPKFIENIEKYSLTENDIAILKGFWIDRLISEMEYASKWIHSFESYTDENDDVHKLIELWTQDKGKREFLKRAHDLYKDKYES